MQWAWKNENNRGHFPITFVNNDFNPAVTITPTSGVWATVTEMDATGDSTLYGDAFVTVQQVVPGNGQVTVEVWVDNVPVNINVRVTLFFAD